MSTVEVTHVLVFDQDPHVYSAVNPNDSSNAVAGPVSFVLAIDEEPIVAPDADPNGSDRFNFPVGMTTGRRGASAYEIAQVHGFLGTEDEWLLSIRGVLVLDPDEDLPTGTPVGTVVYRRVS